MKITKNKINMKNIGLLLILFMISFFSTNCQNINFDQKEIKAITILFQPNPDLRNSPIEIKLDEFSINSFIKILRKSKKKYSTVKEAIYDGRYEIDIVFNNAAKNEKIIVSSSYQFSLENLDVTFSNPILLNYLRNLLFEELIERKIKLE